MYLTLSAPRGISRALLLLMLSAASAHLSAAEDPRDFSGVWQPIATVPEFSANSVPALTPEGEVRVADFAARYPNPVEPGAYCVPAGMPGMLTSGEPLELLQSFSRIAMLGGDGSLRRVFIGAERAFPASAELTRSGLSIAHWENDTLVIETRFLAEALGGRWPRTANTVIVERITKTRRDRISVTAATELAAAHEDNAVLELHLTVTDETLYRRPETFTLYYQQLAAEALPDSSCTEELWQQALDAANQ